MEPTTRYAVTDDGVYIAYQTIGDGPVDIVFVHAFLSHLEIFWELPSYARFMTLLAEHARVIVFDKRGTGLSDRISSVPTLEARLDDLRAVLDAAGSQRPIVVGDGDGAALAAMFAASFPERTLGLVLWSGAVRIAADDDYPWGMTPDALEVRLAARLDHWGDPDRAEESTRMTFLVGDRLVADPHFPRWLVRLQRYATAPGDLARFTRVWFSTDARSALAAIQVPALVLAREGWEEDMIEEARWTASRIPGAELKLLPGDEDDPYLGDVSLVAQAVNRFISSIRDEQSVFDRVLATVLFTDIVDSASRASALGDRAWKQTVERHHATTRALLSRYRGTEVDTAGDGFFATFDGPIRAVHCAQTIIRSMRALGVPVRAGIHTGEVETIDGKAGGLAVIIGARIGAKAGPSEILASQTIRDLTAGSGLSFVDAGDHELKGVPGTWHLMRVGSDGGAQAS
jgi:class 3 adenylate cyclase